MHQTACTASQLRTIHHIQRQQQIKRRQNQHRKVYIKPEFLM